MAVVGLVGSPNSCGATCSASTPISWMRLSTAYRTGWSSRRRRTRAGPRRAYGASCGGAACWLDSDGFSFTERWSGRALLGLAVARVRLAAAPVRLERDLLGLEIALERGTFELRDQLDFAVQVDVPAARR